MAEHMLDGTYRSNRHTGLLQENPMQVEPEHYIKDSEHKTELFTRFAELLHSEGLTSGQVDSLYVSQIVDLYDAYTQAAEFYRSEGVGAKVGNKLAINLMMELQKELRVLLGEYSLTPSTRAAKARTKDTPDEAKEDPVADFLGMKPRLVK